MPGNYKGINGRLLSASMIQLVDCLSGSNFLIDKESLTCLLRETGKDMAYGRVGGLAALGNMLGEPTRNGVRGEDS